MRNYNFLTTKIRLIHTRTFIFSFLTVSDVDPVKELPYSIHDSYIIPFKYDIIVHKNCRKIDRKVSIDK